MKLVVAKKFPPLYKKTTDGKIEEWRIRVDRTPQEYGVIVTTHGHTDGKKQETKDVVSEGKNAGRKSATTALEQAIAEAQSRWTIKLKRKGYDTDPTGEGSALKRALAPMLAQTYEKRAKLVDWETAYAQPKLNGYRCLVRIGDSGNPVAFSREGLVLSVPHICEAIAGVKGLSPGQALDGELYAHGFNLQQISSFCKKLQPATVEHIRFHLYDTVLNVPYATRYLFIKDFAAACGSDVLDVVKTVKVRTAADLDVVEADCIDEGYEGAMLRFGREGYQAGRRSPNLLKVKRFSDQEFKIVDYKMGRGAYAGIPIFMCVVSDDDPRNTFDVTAHGTLEEKRALGADPQAHVGRMLKVKYFGFTSTEKPKPFHPVSLGFSDEE